MNRNQDQLDQETICLDQFEAAFTEKFPQVELKRASKEEDMYSHVDFWMGTKGVDVKTIRRVSRHDDKVDLDTQWVEFRNVRGDLGWLYGKAEYIAFEMPMLFFLFDRRDLVDHCERNTEKTFVTTPQEAFYKLYRRKGRKDMITRISMAKAIGDNPRGIILPKSGFSR